MAYEKNTWETGDIVTSEKLNHFEDGVANASILVVTITVDEYTNTMNKTWQEIYDWCQNGRYAYCEDVLQADDPADEQKAISILPIRQILHLYEGQYDVKIEDVFGDIISFKTSSPDGFPVFVAN